MEKKRFTGILLIIAMTLFVIMFAKPISVNAEVYTDYTASSGTAGVKTDEDYAKLVDNNKETKWCVTSLGDPTYIEFSTKDAIVPTAYTLTTGGDSDKNPGRNPKNWVLKAKLNETDSWTVISQVEDDTKLQDVSSKDFMFFLNNSASYKYYRFEVSSIQSGTVFQLAELQLVTGQPEYDLSYGSISGLHKLYEWNNGQPNISFDVISMDGKKLISGTDYDYVITDSSGASVTGTYEPGTYTLTITGKGLYIGQLTGSFTLIERAVITSSTYDLEDGLTYHVDGNVTLDPTWKTLNIHGKVGIYLEKDYVLTVDNYIAVGTGNELTIDGPGKMVCKWGLGSSDSSGCGTIIINGGTIEATGAVNHAGIGCGNRDNGFNIIINGGTINATGGGYAAGIGGGNGNVGNCSITINGGNINATGGTGGAGIGSGKNGGRCNITINGGDITAKSGGVYNYYNFNDTYECCGAGIGGGAYAYATYGVYHGYSGNITITGGTINASAMGYGAGIGGGNAAYTHGGDADTIKILGGKVTARSEKGYSIGPGKDPHPDYSYMIGNPGKVVFSWDKMTDKIDFETIYAKSLYVEKLFHFKQNGNDKGRAATSNIPTKPADYIMVPFEDESIHYTDFTVNGENAKYYYLIGDTLNVDGMTMTTVESDGNTDTYPVELDMVSGFDSETAGIKTLTITFGDLTTQTRVEVLDDAGYEQKYGPIEGMTVNHDGKIHMGDKVWKVIGKSNDKWLLILDYPINEGIGRGYSWDDTIVRMNKLYEDSFSADEKNAIAPAYKKDIYYKDYFASDLTGEKIFLLSAGEAVYYLVDREDSSHGQYWLRSVWTSDTFRGTIAANGALDYYGKVYTYDYLRPAFILDQSTVLMRSAAEGGKTEEAGSTLAAFNTLTNSECKLTLLDSSRAFNASFADSGEDNDVDTLHTRKAGYSGWTESIQYSGANTGNDEFVSVLLTEEDGTPLYYGSIAKNSEAGTADVDIPNGLKPGTYILNVFSEKHNGDFKTDLGSAFKQLKINVAARSIQDNITVEYRPISEIDPVTVEMVTPEESLSYRWKPSFNLGDALVVTENGVSTTYVLDNYYYKGFEDVRGFYDEDGNALSDRFRCVESGYGGKISSVYPDFEWVGGVPSKSGQNAYYRFLLYEIGSDRDAEPIAVSDPVGVYVKPVKTIDGIKYAITSDGTAMVSGYRDYEMSEFIIRDKVILDDGIEHPVVHIGGANPNGSEFDDDGCFGECDELTSVTIPESIETIKAYAFFNTPKLKEITIPPTVKQIGKYAIGYTGNYDWIAGYTDIEKVSDFVIYAKAGSEGARYAKENGIKCIDLEAQAKEAAANEAYNKAKAEAEAKAKAEAEKAKNTPAKAKLTKLIKGKKKFTVKWKKDAKATGYNIRYSTDKSFKKKVKTKTVKKYSKKGYTIKAAKKTYYVQIRAYKTVDGKTYYGEWSASKKVKVR